MSALVHDERACALGEGPLWHPERDQLFWFDITSQRLMTREGDRAIQWDFDEEVSAAGWIDHDHLLIASASALFRFDLRDGSRTQVVSLEAGNAVTRSNDGRADPWGGFWIGTMGRNAEAKAGAIYRLYQGELRKLFPGITISNAICFAPSRNHAYFTDTDLGKLMRVTLDRAGWPADAPETLIDFHAAGLNPDGAVTDADGNLWIAQWGAARVAVHDANGDFLKAIELPADHTTCPAFGGSDLTTLYVTSARQGLSETTLSNPKQGQTFEIPTAGKGLAEPRVIL